MTKHPPEFTDTDPRAMEVWLDLLRRMTPGDRIAATLQLSDLALRVSESRVRAAFPAADEREVRVRVAASYLPRELMIRAFHWDPELNGDAG